ncbi:MAG: hypothetical protein ACKN9U_05645, partial [Pirellulaceae bacterium]
MQHLPYGAHPEVGFLDRPKASSHYFRRSLEMMTPHGFPRRKIPAAKTAPKPLTGSREKIGFRRNQLGHCSFQ